MAIHPCFDGTFLFAQDDMRACAPPDTVPRAVPPGLANRLRTNWVEPLERRILLSGSNTADPALLRINAGGPGYTDVLDHRWSADSGVGGSVNGASFQIVDAPDPKLFTSRRIGNFSYTLRVPGGSYALELLFAEPSSGPGQRIFNVTADGRPLLTHFDIAATVGVHTALTETLPLTAPAGPLVLKFAGVIGQAILSGLALLPAESPSTPPGALTILPLGDSITYGSTTNEYPSGGYRSRLFQDFVDHHGSIRYLGSAYDTWSTLLEKAGEAWYEGHGGYTIEQIDENIDGIGPGNSASPNNGGHWINGIGSRQPIYPDVILLHAGTNDILEGHSGASAASAMDALIDKITTERPNAELFVAQIIPIVNPAENAQVKSYNSLLRTEVVPKYQKLHRHVILVNQYSDFVDAKGNVLSYHFGDGIHPDQAGYDLIGDTWYAAIERFEAEHVTTTQFGEIL